MSNPESETQEIQVYKKTQYLLRSDEALQRFSETMGNMQLAKTFVASVLLVVAENVALQMCTSLSIMGAAMRAATLRLSVEPSQGHAYLVPYKNKCTFIIGYKGLIQLALRTNNYRDINVTAAYEGEKIIEDRLTGRHSFGGGKTSDVEVGYLSYFQLRNGMTKTFYMTKEEAEAYGKRYAPSFNRNDSLWKTNFPAMAKKTVLKQLLSKWGDFNERDQAALKLALSNDEEIIEEEKWNVAIEDQKQIEDVKEAAEEAKFAAMTPDDLVMSLGYVPVDEKSIKFSQPIPDEQVKGPSMVVDTSQVKSVKIVEAPEPGSIFDIEPETLEGRLSNLLNSIDQVKGSIKKHPTNEILIKRMDQLLMDKEKLEKEIAAAAK